MAPVEFLKLLRRHLSKLRVNIGFIVIYLDPLVYLPLCLFKASKLIKPENLLFYSPHHSLCICIAFGIVIGGGKILILSVTKNLLRIVSQTKFELELELKSLTTPLEELEDKIKAFEDKRHEVMIEKSDFDILLDSEIKRLVKDILDEEIERFKKELVLQVSTSLENYFNENRHLSLNQLHKALEQQVIVDVKQAFNGWRVIEDERLAKAFESICKRFILKINDTVDALLKFSSELFHLTRASWISDGRYPRGLRQLLKE